jgi:hypothetical protein
MEVQDTPCPTHIPYPGFFSHPGSPVHPLFFLLRRAKLKNQKEVCLDPEAPVIKKIIQKILGRYLLS